MASGPGSASGAIADALGAPRQRQAAWQSDIPQRLVLQSFTAHERLSVPYIIQAEVAAPGGPIDFVPHLGKGAHIIVSTDGLPTRRFHGFLFSAEQSETGDSNGERYRLELRPWLYFLKQVTHWRIFQAKTVVEVLTEVVGEYGRGFNLDTQSLKGYSAREYICQFGESDFDFLSRLMEEEGIYYYFDFRQDGHWLVACDGPGSHKSVGAVSHRPALGGAREGVRRFDRRVHRVVKTAQITDYDFQKAKETIQAKDDGKGDAPLAPGSVRDYPADINDSAQIAQLAPKRLQGLQAEGSLFDVETDHLELIAGGLFDLNGHTSPELNTSYLTVGLSLAFTNPSPRSGSEDAAMHLALEAAPKATPWRPARVTPKRIARGPQTAVVVGPDSDNEIHIDDWGRVRVRFRWDESKPPADKKGQDSCWMRVSHGWAGHRMGEKFLPRVGHEVIVDFLDGDPERPIITGRVFNSENVIGKLSTAQARKTRSGWFTQTVLGKSTQEYDGAVSPPTDEPGYNALMFEDKAGEEEVYIRAQREFFLDVFRNSKQWTHKDREDVIGHNLSLEVTTGDETRKVLQGSRTTTIHKDDTHTVETGSRKSTINQKETLIVEQSDMATTVKQGNQSTEISMGNQSIAIKMGNQTTKLDLGAASTEAMQSITLKVGQNSIVIDQMGITIKGMMVQIEGQVMLSAKAPMTQVNADAMLTLKGGITMIN